jgi:hypothetical protein
MDVNDYMVCGGAPVDLGRSTVHADGTNHPSRYVPAMGTDQPAPSSGPLGPVDFSTHVLSLASTALIALGKMPAPDDEPQALDLETAKHLIDVLGMLEQKTKGNLDETESKLLASLTYDLRVAFVDAQKAAPKG